MLHGADPLYNEYPDLPDSLRQQINEALLCYLSQPPSVCNAQLSQTIAGLIAAINALFEADYAIRFRDFSEQHYGFDSLMYQPMVDDYNFLTVANQPYRVAWKSVEAGRSDSVLLLTPFAQLPDSLHFETNSRTPVPHHEHACGAGCADNGAAILPVAGGEHNKTYQIYPVQTRRDSLGNPERKYAGKLNVVSYNKKVTQVVIVPVNGAGNLTDSDRAAIESQLNEIYRPAVAAFTVEPLRPLQLDWFATEAQNTLDSTNSAFYADYNAQMQRINQEINRLPGYDPQKYYLIVVQNAQGGIKGFMPRARNKGFIVAAGHGSLSDLGRTMAHELGHGAFRLRHPWEQFSGLVPGQTDNLMDYASGTRLHHYQWHIVHNPPPLAGLLDGDEEGELAGEASIMEFSDQNCSADSGNNSPASPDYAYFTPSGKAIRFTNGLSNAQFFETGGLFRFRTGGQPFVALIVRHGDFGRFYGYVTTDIYDDFVRRLNRQGDQSVMRLIEGGHVSYFNDYTFAPVGHSVFTKASRKLSTGQILNNCICEYTWSNPTQAQSMVGKSDRYIPDQATHAACNGPDGCNASNSGILAGSTLANAIYFQMVGHLPAGISTADLTALANYIAQQVSAAQPLSPQQRSKLELQPDPNDADESKYVLKFMAQSLHQPKNFGFYGGNGNFIQNDVLSSEYPPCSFTTFLTQQNIFTVSAFNAYFPPNHRISTPDCNIIFSTVDLKEDLPAHYNHYSADWASFEHKLTNTQTRPRDYHEILYHIRGLEDYFTNIDTEQLDAATIALLESTKLMILNYGDYLRREVHSAQTQQRDLEYYYSIMLNLKNIYFLLGACAPYEYKAKDLFKRRQLLDLPGGGGVFYQYIRDLEEAGEAQPIFSVDAAEQYRAYYGTNSAWFLGQQYEAAAGIIYAGYAMHTLAVSPPNAIIQAGRKTAHSTVQGFKTARARIKAAIRRGPSGFNLRLSNSPATVKTNVRAVRQWAKAQKNYIKKSGSGSNSNTPEEWGVIENGAFSTRVKIDHRGGATATDVEITIYSDGTGTNYGVVKRKSSPSAQPEYAYANRLKANELHSIPGEYKGRAWDIFERAGHPFRQNDVMINKLADDLQANPNLEVYLRGDLVEGTRAWEQAINRGIDIVIRSRPEFLGMVSRFPFNPPTSKQTLIDNASDSDWSEIFSGKLVNVPNPDLNAAGLVNRFGGRSGVKFDTDPSAKEFDLISNNLIGEHKVLSTTSTINSGDRYSYRMQMIAAKKNHKDAIWVFEGVQNNSHINKVIQYANEYRVNTIIEVNGVILHNITF